ncbi:hypothetical protein Ancab_026771 [Ancistrocladus abbreviatus]
MGNCANKPLTSEGEKGAPEPAPEPAPDVAEPSSAVTTEEKVVEREIVVDELMKKAHFAPIIAAPSTPVGQHLAPLIAMEITQK